MFNQRDKAFCNQPKTNMVIYQSVKELWKKKELLI